MTIMIIIITKTKSDFFHFQKVEQTRMNVIIDVDEEILEEILTQQITEVHMTRLWGIQVLCTTIE